MIVPAREWRIAQRVIPYYRVEDYLALDAIWIRELLRK
jgi:hypothetical protein